MSVGGVWRRYGRGNPSHRSDTDGWEAHWQRCQLQLFVTGVFLWRCWNIETPSRGHLSGSHFAKQQQSVRCCVFPGCDVDDEALDVGFEGVFIAFALSSDLSTTTTEFDIQQLLGDTGVWQLKDVTRSVRLCLLHGDDDAREFRPL